MTNAWVLAAAFSAATVLQIQQSHFFTMDTFINLFSFLAFYFAVRVLVDPSAVKKPAVAPAFSSTALTPPLLSLPLPPNFHLPRRMLLVSLSSKTRCSSSAWVSALPWVRLWLPSSTPPRWRWPCRLPWLSDNPAATRKSAGHGFKRLWCTWLLQP